MTIQNHRQLVVWQRAMELARQTFRLMRRLPRHEVFGLVSQARRAATSIPSNIAEGNGRVHRGDYVRHLSIARGSLCELDTLLDLAHSEGYLSNEELAPAHELLDHVGRMLTQLIRRLRT